MPDEGGSGDGAGPSSASGDGKDKKEDEGGNGKHKKLLRLLTVFAYLSTVSGTAFMLSLYYLFLWTPKVQLGGKALVQDPPPPGTLALFYPEMAPQLAARMAEEEVKAKGAPQWAARTQGGPHGKGKARGQVTGEAAASESQVPATPQLVLPPAAEASGRRREARSTLMEMSTTQQTPLTTTAALHDAAPSRASGSLLAQRAKSKAGAEVQGSSSWGGGGGHSTPHPAEVAVHA